MVPAAGTKRHTPDVRARNNMPIPTEPRQPIIYDMMLLADALLSLRSLARHRITTRSPDFPARQKELEIALTKIRSLAQFMGNARDRTLIKIDDPAFGGTIDPSFERQWFGPISEYLSHPNVQRYRKERRHRRPTVRNALDTGKLILDQIKPLIDRQSQTLRGDARHWYGLFEDRYSRL